MTNNIKLQEVCKQLHIPVVGTTSWPLPNEARQILCESNPCPFTAADLDERLMGTPDFMPRSAIVCLFPYHVSYSGATNLARYTWATDYHLVVTDYLQRLVDELSSTNPSELFSIHCDTSPLADRYMAYLAGLGFYGKNKCFINPTWGSYIVIGTVLTTLEFEPNTPMADTCMGCNQCITSCLGQCLDGNEFNYATCKSYLTQKKGDLTNDEQSIIKKSPLVFGCDVCQEVCPHNKDLPTTPIVESQSIEPYVDIEELESISNKEFKAKYGHRAFSWRGKKILIRNNEYIDTKTLQQK